MAFPDPLSILQTVFGYGAFRGEQAAVIERIVAGESCCVLMPTGGGKSLCYQIPALCRPGTAVVISPLIALMDDQVAALRELGVRAAAIHSGGDGGAVAETLRTLRAGGLDLVYVSPERLMTEDFLDLLDTLPIALFAIDEAHCISQWGHDFRPEYQQLSLLCTRYGAVPRIAVTATADEPTRQEIMARLQLPFMFKAGFDRPNIRYHVAVKNNPSRQLLAFLRDRPAGESGIVYCLSRKRTEEIAQLLCDEGYDALPYHAGLDPGVRAKNQERFIKEEGIVMVATIAFGMGINKPDVRFVAHLDLPKTIEAYYQETGRAGRDGLPATAWMVYGMQDVVLRRQMIEDSDAPEEQKRLELQKLTALLGYCETATCRRRVLLNYFGDATEDCGNCDTCLDPPKTFDATTEAQKVLSCVYRTGQRYGSGYVIDVLTGRGDDERIGKAGHDKISTFGIGADRTKPEWQGIVRQLLSYGLIHADPHSHGALQITPEGARFLKEKTQIRLRFDEKERAGRGTGAANRAESPLLDNEADRDLFARLKTLRLSLAKAQNLPPYVIFHDKTLLDIVMLKPRSLSELGMINGIGQSKRQRYGDAFLAVVNGG